MTNVPDEWECRSHLGTGGFGVVELWRNNSTMEMIAIKRCKAELSEKQTERWINEIKTMDSLQHPNIVRTRHVPEQLCRLQNSLPVLCMEYCSHGDLRAVLNKTSNCCGIKEKEVFKIMDNIASAVKYLHSHKLTHRDLKPENIVIQDSGEGMIYKLTDFGYICELDENTLDRSVVGTLNYLAPELLCRPGGYTCSVDYWSLGILFYEIITGNRPFFPDMNVTPKWMEYMKKKENKHICAYEEDDRVVFNEEIGSPSTISSCMRDKLRVWFRLVLQWDPKSRGRAIDEGGNGKLVVFSLLKNLLSSKMLYVFVVPLYRFDSYVVGPEINVRELQILIRDKTGIEVTDQIISNSECTVLTEPDSMVFNTTKDSRLYVFHSRGPNVSQKPPPVQSKLIQRILANPKKLLKHESMKRHYRAVVFFVNQERKLFRAYILALSINIDLSNKALENLHETVKNLRTQADDLLSKLTVLKQPSEYHRMSCGLRQYLDTTVLKTQRLFDITKSVTANIDALTEEFNDLEDISKNTWLEQWTLEYKKATVELESVTRLKTMPDKPPLKMVKLLYRVLRMQNEQLQNPEIEKTVRRITEFQKNILQLQRALSSFHGLIDLYRKNYDDILIAHDMEDENWWSAFIESTPQCDTLIFDNTVLHNVIESLDGFQYPSIEDFESMDL